MENQNTLSCSEICVIALLVGVISRQRVISADSSREEIGGLLKEGFLLWKNVAVPDYSLESEVNWDQREDQAHKES